MTRLEVAAVLSLVCSTAACERKSSTAPGVVSVQRDRSDTRPPGDASASTPDAAQSRIEPMTVCDIARRFLKRASSCVPGAAKELQGTLSNLETMIVEAHAEKAPQSARDQVGSMCAMTAYSHDKHLSTATDLTCPIALSADERSATRTYLDAYYGRRTKPRPTGDAALDRELAALAASRDAMCSCVDVACVQQTHKIVDAAVKPVPKERTDAMADSEALIDEVSRCSNRIENVGDIYP